MKRDQVIQDIIDKGRTLFGQDYPMDTSWFAEYSDSELAAWVDELSGKVVTRAADAALMTLQAA